MTETPDVDLATHPLSGVSMIEASAGTGKTFTIAHLYLRALLEKGYSVQQILVVTFTRAATQELKGRIRELLNQLLQELQQSTSSNSFLDALFGQYRQNPDKLKSLQRALVNFDEAAIFSIHGFCQRALQSYPLETGSQLQQELIADEKELIQKAVQDYWRKLVYGQSAQDLDWLLKQWNTPDALYQDLKTLLEKPDPTLEKTNVPELESSWQSLLEIWREQRPVIEALFLHSEAFRQNSKYKPHTLQALLQQVDDLDANHVPGELPDNADLLDYEKICKSMYKNKQDERAEISSFRLWPAFLEQHRSRLKAIRRNLLLDASRQVQLNLWQSKQAAQSLSFNDLIIQLSDALQRDSSAGRNKLQEKMLASWPLAMVDEFQDTDEYQYRIFNTIYGQAMKHRDTGLILIGDPKQAIYRFRGADVFTYQRARSNTPRQFTLKTNYRSSADYVDAVNQIFQRPDAFVFPDLIEYQPGAANPEQNKTVTDRHAVALPPLKCWLLPRQEKPINKGEVEETLSQLCANEIAQLLQQKNLLLDGKPAEAGDLAILVRTGSQARLMKQQLAARGINTALILRDSVFKTEQAREITLLLEVLITSSNIPRLAGLLSTDLFGWDVARIEQLHHDNEQLVALLERMQGYQSLWQEKGVLAMFFQLLEDQHCLSRIMAKNEGERQLTNWLQIAELIEQQSAQHASHNQALRWLQQQRELAGQKQNEEHQLRLDSDRNLVRIVTIHRSKGLQYPVVFLPFMSSVFSNGRPPNCYQVHDASGQKQTLIFDDSQKERLQQEDLAEEVRVFYVAITRAVYRCYIGFADANKAGNTALAQCLFARKGNQLAIKSNEDLRAPFEALNDEKMRIEINQSLPSQTLVFTPPPSKQKPSALQFNRPLRQQWRITSYSQLALSGSAEHIDRPDYDAIMTDSSITPTDEPPAIARLDRFSFPKGAKAGTFLHDLLEHQAFNQSVDAQMIAEKCQSYGFDTQWQFCLVDWLNDILASDLKGFSLNFLGPEKCLVEMEFYMSCDRLAQDALNACLFEKGYSQSPDNYHFSTISGYLKGFIDLVFEFDGQYYVADYKSNFLGPREQDYQIEQCRQAMFEHHYHLQYLIYTLALHRYLKQRLKDYDYTRDFGGVFYLFLRGMSAQSSDHQGIYFDKPPLAVIEKLDALFEGVA